VQNKNIPGTLTNKELVDSSRNIDQTIQDAVKFFKDIGVVN